MLSSILADVLSLAYQHGGQIMLIDNSTDEERNNITTLANNRYLKAIGGGNYILLEKGLRYVETNSLADAGLITRNQKIRQGLKFVQQRAQQGKPEVDARWRHQMASEGIDDQTINIVANYMLLAEML